MIRPATPEQIEEIITRHVPDAMYEGSLQLNPRPDSQRVRQMVQAVLERGGRFSVAVEQERLVGYVLFGTNRDFFTEEVVGYIYELYVLPEQRGKGYARQLLQTAHQELKASGLQEVRLNVFAGNLAEKLYQSLGYQDRSKMMSLPLT